MSGTARPLATDSSVNEEETKKFYVDHSGEIAEHISSLFNNKSYSDITLEVNSTNFYVHRVILASRSEYFRALFFGGLSESNSSVIHLKDINEKAFFHILSYIYTGRLNISNLQTDAALSILGLACQYNFPNLQDALCAHFMRALTIKSVCPIYNAAITYDLDNLIEACLQFCDQFASTILSLPEFIDLSKASILRMITRDSFYVPEFEILRALQRWLDAVHRHAIDEALMKIQNLDGISENFATNIDEIAAKPKQDHITKSEITKGSSCLSDIVRCRIDREAEELRGEMSKCIRFELMSLAELSTEVRSSRMLSADALLDAIGCKTSKSGDNLHLRGRLLPEVNLAVPRLGCSLISGNWGNYPFFFIDSAPNDDLADLQSMRNFQIRLSESERDTQCRATVHQQQYGQRVPQTLYNQLSTSGIRCRDAKTFVPPLPSSSAWIGNPNVPSFSARTFHNHGITVDNEAPQLNSLLMRQEQQVTLDTIRGNRSLQTVPDSLADFRGEHLESSTYASVQQQQQARQQIGSAASEESLASTPASILQRQGTNTLAIVEPSLKKQRQPVVSNYRTLRIPNLPAPESELSVVSHPIGVRGGQIVIDLGHNSFVNMISMQLWDREPRSYSYYAEVSLSMDGEWHRVVDYSTYVCRSWQTLYFPARVIRFIRIVGTRSSVSQYFHLVTFQCFYTREQFRIQNGLLVPRNNVATVQLGATVLEGVSRLRNSLIDGDVLVYNLNYGFTCHQLGNGAISVQLSQPFLVASMRFLLWDLDNRAYSYTVEVSLNRQTWQMVFDASHLQCRSWQTITFPLQAIAFIRITGIDNTANNVFHLVHLECPASTLDPDAVASGPQTTGETHIMESEIDLEHATPSATSTNLPNTPVFFEDAEPFEGGSRPSAQLQHARRPLAAFSTSRVSPMDAGGTSVKSLGHQISIQHNPQHHRLHHPSSSSLQCLTSRTASFSSIRPQSGDEEHCSSSSTASSSPQTAPVAFLPLPQLHSQPPPQSSSSMEVPRISLGHSGAVMSSSSEESLNLALASARELGHSPGSSSDQPHF